MTAPPNPPARVVITGLRLPFADVVTLALQLALSSVVIGIIGVTVYAIVSQLWHSAAR